MKAVRIYDYGKTNIKANEITAFLESLMGPFPEQMIPRLPPTPGDLIDTIEIP